jgi:hypothetical protein
MVRDHVEWIECLARNINLIKVAIFYKEYRVHHVLGGLQQGACPLVDFYNGAEIRPQEIKAKKGIKTKFSLYGEGKDLAWLPRLVFIWTLPRIEIHQASL